MKKHMLVINFKTLSNICNGAFIAKTKCLKKLTWKIDEIKINELELRYKTIEERNLCDGTNTGYK